MSALLERWQEVVAGLPKERRPPDTAETREILERLFRFAPAQGEFLLLNPGYLKELLQAGLLEHGQTEVQVRNACANFVRPPEGRPETSLESGNDPLTRLRLWKRREFFRIAVRDLLNKAPVEEIMSELSTMASVCVQSALDTVREGLAAKLPAPKTPFAVLGLGKLGGRELNYNSDIDLIYIYEEEGQAGRITHHEWFGRLAQSLTQELTRMDTHGSLFRVDLRLRPEGSSGPIVHSLDSCEHYYAAFGETWERLALGKARGVAGEHELAYEFCQRLQPFIYPRSISPDVFDEIDQIKKRIEAEIVGPDALERHVKLGRGGIREIEFITQSLQLLHGARQPFLHETGTLKSLQALHRTELLARETLQELVRAYRCFRMVEHRLQMRYDLQTHTLPPGWEKSPDLFQSLGYSSAEAFVSEFKEHQNRVRKVFSSLLGEVSVRPAVTLDWPPEPSESVLRDLAACGFKDHTDAYQTLLALSHGPKFVHTSSRTKILFSRLWPIIREQLPREARPDLCLKQLERFTEAYGTRSALFEILLRRPKLLEILFLIFDNSRYLTDTIIRHPEFIEDIALTGTLDYQKTPADVAREIRAMTDAGLPLEKVLRLTKRSELLRIELRAMMGKAGLNVTMQEWSELAEVCLTEAAAAVEAPKDFAVIAMGKFGGKELSNGSDLDITFVGEDVRKAVRILKIMNETTEDGIVFPMDARLRPYGSDGLLSVPLSTYRDYYAGKAQFWEKLALTRARPVTGDPEVRAQFEALIEETIYRRPIDARELAEIFSMRQRIESERSTKGHDPRATIPEPRFTADYKTGKGGLVDLEFMAQTLQLLNGCRDPVWRDTNTIQILRLHRADRLVENYLFLRKMEFSLRRFHLTEESSIPRDEEQQWILARHMGFKDFESFLKVYEPILEENRSGWEGFKTGLTNKMG